MTATVVPDIRTPRVVRVANLGISKLRSVTDEAALQAIPMRVRQLAFVETYRSLFRWAVDSALPPLSGEVIQDVGGQWLRQPVADPSWAYESEWGIDPVNGDDQSTAPGVTRLRTLAELRRRLNGQTLRQSTRVLQYGDVNENIDLTLRTANVDDRFVYAGAPSAWTEVASGTLTDVRAVNRTANPPNAQHIIDVAVASWTPYAGMRVRLTSGVNIGATAFIAADLGLYTARTTRFCHGGGFDPWTATTLVPTLVDPAANDQYVIERLPGVGGVFLDLVVSGTSSTLRPFCYLDSVEFGKATATVPDAAPIVVRSKKPILVTRSASFMRNVDGPGPGGGGGLISQNTMWRNGVFWNGSTLAAGGQLRGTGTTSIFANNGSRCNMRHDFLSQGILVQPDSQLWIDAIGASVWDTAGTAIEIFAGRALYLAGGVLYGSNFGDDGLQIEPMGSVHYLAGTKINLRADVGGSFSGGHDIEIGPDSVPYSSDDLLTAPGGSIWDKEHSCGVLFRGTD